MTRREMVHLAIDGMWQVIKLQRSTPRNDFCRIAAKNGILLRLTNTLYSLNEATRLASVSGGGGFPVDGVILRPRSGPLDPGHPAFVQSSALPYGFDYPDYLKVKHGVVDNPISSGTHDSTRASVSLSSDSRFFPLDSDRPRLSAASLEGPVTSKSHDASSFDKPAHATLKERSDPLRAAHRISTDRTPTLTDGFSNGHSATVTQQDNVRPLLSLLDKEPPSRHVSGQLEYVRHLTGMEKHENMLPLLQASNERKTTNGLDFLMAEFAGVYFIFSSQVYISVE